MQGMMADMRLAGDVAYANSIIATTALQDMLGGDLGRLTALVPLAELRRVVTELTVAGIESYLHFAGVPHDPHPA